MSMVPTGTAGGDSHPERGTRCGGPPASQLWGTPAGKVVPMPQPVLLITGTSSGIGLSTSVVAARHGYRLVATMRNLDGAGSLRAAAEEAGVELDVRRLDVTDQASITTCVDGVVADHGHLDVVVNNAGAGHIGTIGNESLDDVRQVMEVNFFGVVAVTKAVIPHLRASHGRIVTVTSVGGAVGQPFNEAYCAAKFAVEGFMESLAPVAESLGVGVAVVEPGPVATEFVNNIDADPDKLFGEAGPYEPALRAYIGHVMAEFSSATSVQTAHQVAEEMMAALRPDSPALRFQTSHWAREFVARKLADHRGASVVGLTSGWLH